MLQKLLSLQSGVFVSLQGLNPVGRGFDSAGRICDPAGRHNATGPNIANIIAAAEAWCSLSLQCINHLGQTFDPAGQDDPAGLDALDIAVAAGWCNLAVRGFHSAGRTFDTAGRDNGTCPDIKKYDCCCSLVHF